MEKYKEYKELFEKHLNSEYFIKSPHRLYEPIQYTLSAGGKRLRPVLCLLGCLLFDGDIYDAMPAAIATEVFHNFTLVHDDVMDNSPLRRGQPTVFKKWNPNIAILSGDVMFAKAYEYVAKIKNRDLKPILNVFTDTAIKVCEGQQYDLDFETQKEVTIDEYINMIHLKTAVLFGASLKIGAIIAGATEEQHNKIYDFGINMGYVFQLQDDYLDLFADAKKFGKKIGLDICSGKKTFLYLKAIELMKETQKKQFQSYYADLSFSQPEKINKIKRLFEDLNIKRHTINMMNKYHNKSLKYLKSISDCNIEIKKELISLLGSMLNRDI